MADPTDLDWTRDELVIALDIFHRYATDTEREARIERLSGDLKRLGVYPAESQYDNHRSPAGIGMLFQKFASLKSGGKTASREIKQGVHDVWDKYGGRVGVTMTEAKRIRGRFKGGS